MSSFVVDALSYNITGPENAPLVVLIHGIGLNRNIWDSYIPELAKHRRVLSYDLPGHGQSTVLNKKPELKDLAEQIRFLLNLTGYEQCDLIGFSLGGMINRRFAMDFCDGTRTLVILNSPHGRTSEQQEQVESQAQQNILDGPAATIDATLQRWFTPAFLKNNLSQINLIKKWVLSNNLENYAHFRWLLARGVLELIEPKLPIFKPALVITCENDRGSTPAMSHAIASEISGSEINIIPDLQHLGLLEQPEQFLKPITHFLDQHSPI